MFKDIECLHLMVKGYHNVMVKGCHQFMVNINSKGDKMPLVKVKEI